MGVAIAATMPGTGQAADTKDNMQQAFDSPKAAVDSLFEACRSNDTNALIRIFGSRYRDAVEKIDDAEERQHRQVFWERSQAHLKLVEKGDDRVELVVGKELWEFPIPLVKKSRGWIFDTDEGFEEMLARRIGENELNAIEVCREYAIAQQEYAAADRDGDEVLEYAQRIASTHGKQDGLYWEVKEESSEPLSPLGHLLADAEGALQDRKPGSPYLGYYFRILTRQGPNPPGGAYDYVINGNMIAGFALIAWPADYRASGVMTFVISHQGKLFEKDLGPDTSKLVESIVEYNLDQTWILVKP
jgi:hypothetical protein